MTKLVIEIDPLFKDLVPAYLANREKEIIVIEELISKNDFDQIQILAHKLAGNAGSYGFDALSVMGKKMEMASIEKKMDVISETFEEIKKYLDSIEVVYK